MIYQQQQQQQQAISSQYSTRINALRRRTVTYLYDAVVGWAGARGQNTTLEHPLQPSWASTVHRQPGDCRQSTAASHEVR